MNWKGPIAEETGQPKTRWCFVFRSTEGVAIKVVPATVAVHRFWTLIVSDPELNEGREVVEGRRLPVYDTFGAAMSAARKALAEWERGGGAVQSQGGDEA